MYTRLCGDGDMMEGISSEAASLAGHLKLPNLCWLYDSNRVTIEGHTDLAFTEDVAARFMAYGWEVTRVSDPNDTELVERALKRFHATKDRPTMIIVHSHIGYGAPHKQDSAAAHGEPLGPEEVRLTKEFFGFSPDEFFVVPPGVREHFAAKMGARGSALRKEWDGMFARYKAQYPDLADNLERMKTRDLPPGWEKALPTFPASASGMSTRDASGKVLNAVAQKVPYILGGAADLYPSTKTRLEFEFAGEFQAESELGNYKGRNFHFGIREHAMCAIVNGMVLTGLRAYRLRIPDLHRLRARLHSSLFADGHSRTAHLDSRHHQSRRRRAHASADRAVGVVAGGAGHGRDSSGRCQRDGGGVPGGAVFQGSPG